VHGDLHYLDLCRHESISLGLSEATCPELGANDEPTGS
jgi:hypothetical protein